MSAEDWALDGSHQRAMLERAIGPLSVSPARAKPSRSGPAVILDAAVMLKPEDAAATMAMSVDSFEKYVKPEIKCIRRGSMRFYTVTEIKRWTAENEEVIR